MSEMAKPKIHPPLLIAGLFFALMGVGTFIGGDLGTNMQRAAYPVCVALLIATIGPYIQTDFEKATLVAVTPIMGFLFYPLLVVGLGQWGPTPIIALVAAAVLIGLGIFGFGHKDAAA